MRTETFRHISKIDKLGISAVKHLPYGGEPDCLIVISHGMGDYKERYAGFASALCSEGFGVYIHDHRGHGETGIKSGRLGHFADRSGWFAAVSDLLALVNIAKNDYPQLPVFLIGHSLGSFLALTTAIKWGPLIDGLLLCATGFPSTVTLKSGKAAVSAASSAFGQDRSLLLINALCFAGYALSVKNPKTEFDWICRDDDVVSAFITDPKSQFLYSNRFFLDLIEGLQYNSKPENLNLLPASLPILFFSGTDDPVGDHTRGVRKLADLLNENGCEDVSVNFYRDMRHEVLNEIGKEEVYGDIISWLNIKKSRRTEYQQPSANR